LFSVAGSLAGGCDGIAGKREQIRYGRKPVVVWWWWVGSRNVETVTRKTDKLYIQGTWEASPTELLPEKADTFFVRGAS
jgi:hypothetical protein